MVMQARLRWLNSLPEDAAREALLSCCGSRKWAEEMVRRRPFADLEELLNRARSGEDLLTAQDWNEAFAAHPRIGEKRAGDDEQAQRWSEQEQLATAITAIDVRQRLRQRNEDYYSRFGYIFIVCATGKSAEEMLTILEARIHNDPNRELEIAASEQGKITQLRLQKLIGE